MIGGCAFGDYDGDGLPDLYVTNSIPQLGQAQHETSCGRLYRNLGGGRFEDVTAKSGIRACGLGMGAFWADLDGDGRLDLYLTNVGPNAVWWNRGDGTFEEGKDTGLEDPLFSVGAAFLDYDGDGRLDVVVANYLDSTPEWEAAQPQFELRVPEDYIGPAVAPLPQRRRPQVPRRDRGGGPRDPPGGDEDARRRRARLRRRRPARPLLRQRPRRPTGSSATAATARSRRRRRRPARARSGDAARARAWASRSAIPFGDGRDSLFVTNFGAEPNSLYRNVEGALFEDAGTASGVAADRDRRTCAGGPHFADFDNDGWPDLYAVGGHLAPRIVRDARPLPRAAAPAYVEAGDRAFAQPTVLLHNLGGKRFEAWPDSGDLGARPHGRPRQRRRRTSTATAPSTSFIVDLDGPSRVFQNALGTPAELDRDRAARRAATAARSSARASRVTSGGRSQTQTYRVSPSYASGSLTPLHFGLGAAETASRRRGRAGRTAAEQVFRDVAARRLYGVRPGAELTPIAAR